MSRKSTTAGSAPARACSASTSTAATASIGEPAFLGSPVTNAVATRATAPSTPRSTTDTSACTSIAATTAATRGPRSRRPSTRPSPRACSTSTRCRSARSSGRRSSAGRSSPGHRRRAGRAVVRHDPGRSVPLGRPRRLVAAGRGACGTCPTGRSGSAAATTTPASTRSASTRAAPAMCVVGVSCGGAWRTDGRWRDVAGRGARHAGQLPAARTGRRSRHPGPAPHRSRCADEPDVLWCQHHCGIFRTTDNGDKWVEIEQAGPSTFGFAVAAHPHDPLDRVVRAGDQRRGARAGRRADGRHPHPRRRRHVRRARPTACRRRDAYDLSTATGSTSTPPASSCCSARPPDRCGTAATAATRSSRSRPTCRPVHSVRFARWQRTRRRTWSARPSTRTRCACSVA